MVRSTDAPSEQSESPGAVVGARVLVVDDQPANVLLLESLLGRLGAAEVCSVTDPLQALGHFQRIRPDLVLLDLHMPRLSGLELMADLRRATPEGEFLPIVVLTADATDVARQEALRQGANDFLTKPLDLTEVALRVCN